ncbi:MAG: hypothetical protein U5R49_25895 [Deltaproteobacteria bacterium]|nr:hypothetical protein [Deltaproteobacteria bacterium]
MKTLHILKSEPDNNTTILMDILSRDAETTVAKVYEESTDYEGLIDQIFEHDRTVCWW